MSEPNAASPPSPASSPSPNPVGVASPRVYAPTGEVRVPRVGELCASGDGDGVTRCQRPDLTVPRPIYREVPVCVDDNVAGLCEFHRNRAAFGLNKYGVTTMRNDFTLRNWLQHALEECMDQAVYLRRAITILDAEQQAKVCGSAARCQP